MSQKRSKRLYRVSGETETGHTQSYTFQTKSRAIETAKRWALGSEGEGWFDPPIAPLKNVRIDVSEEVFFPSDHGHECIISLDSYLPTKVGSENE
jgi:hypothetical protein